MNGIGSHMWRWIWLGVMVCADPRWAVAQNFGRQVTRPFLKPNASVPVGTIQHLSFRQQDGRLQLLGLAADKTVRIWQFDPAAKTIIPQQVFRWPISGGQIGQGCDLQTAADGRAALAVCPIGSSSTVYWMDSDGQWSALPNDGLNAVVEWASVSLHPVDASRLAVAYSRAGVSARVVVWSLGERAPRPVQSFTSRLTRVDQLRFSPRGTQLLALDAEQGRSQSWRETNGRWTAQPVSTSDEVAAMHWIDGGARLLSTCFRRVEWSAPERDSSGAWPVLLNLSDRAVSCRLGGRGMTSLDPGRAAWTTEARAALALETRPANLPTFVNSNAARDICYTVHAQSGGKRLELGIVEMMMASAAVADPRRVALAFREVIPTVDSQGQVVSTDRRQRLVVVDGQGDSGTQYRHSSFRLLQDGGFETEIRCLALSADGRFLAAAGLDDVAGQTVNRLKIWDATRGVLLAEFPRTMRDIDGGLPIAAVEVAPGGRGVRFAWGNHVPSIERNRKLLQTAGGQQRAGRALNFETGIQHNSRLMATKLRRSVGQQWLYSDAAPMRFALRAVDGSDETSWGPFPSLMKGQPPRAAVQFELGKRVCLAVAGMGLIRVFDLRTEPPRLLRVFFGGHEGAITSLDVWADSRTPAASWLLSGADDGTLCGWSLEGLESEPVAAPFRGKGQEQFIGELSLQVSSQPGGSGRQTTVLAHELGLGYAWGISRDREQLVRKLEVRRGQEWRDVPDADWQRVLQRPQPGQYLKLTLEDPLAGRDQELVMDVRQPPLWTLYPLVDGDWIVWANTGEFLASDRSGMRLRNRLGWHSNAVDARAGLVARWQDVHERWAEHHNFNDLHRRLNDRLAVSSQLETHFPSKVEFVKTPASGELARPDDFEVTVRVSPALDGEIERLQLWCNGFLLEEQIDPPADVLEQDGSLILKASVPPKVQRLSQVNTLTARVINRFANGDRGGSEPVEWSFEVNQTPPPRRVHYLGVGVTRLDNKLVNGNRPLRYAANDAVYLSRALKSALDWEPGQVRLLVDEDQVTGGMQQGESAITPAKHNIGRAFVELLDIVRPDDLLVVLLATHGEMANGQFYLMARDSRDTRDHPDLRSTWFSGEELKNWLSQLPCACLLLVDACHSGGLNLAEGYFDFGPGPHVFVSSRNNQASFEGVQVRKVQDRWIGHGLFTAAVIDGLSGVQRNAQQQMVAHRRVTNLSDLPGYVIRRVPDLLEMVLPRRNGENDRMQEPKLLPSSTFPTQIPLSNSVER